MALRLAFSPWCGTAPPTFTGWVRVRSRRRPSRSEKLDALLYIWVEDSVGEYRIVSEPIEYPEHWDRPDPTGPAAYAVPWNDLARSGR